MITTTARQIPNERNLDIRGADNLLSSQPFPTIDAAHSYPVTSHSSFRCVFHPEYVTLLFPTTTTTLQLRFLAPNPEVILTNSSNLSENPFASATEILYHDLWPGITARFHVTNRRLKYEFIVSPRADLDDICLSYHGADHLYLHPSGDLHLYTAHGMLVEKKPVSFQPPHKTEINTCFSLDNKQQIRFVLEEEVDRSLPLVIDPVIFYSTYLGGRGSDTGMGIAVDRSGFSYVTGSTQSRNFPVTSGSFQTSYPGGTFSTFVTKINQSGTSLVYSTFLGGRESDVANAIRVNSDGEAYVTGVTSSTNFPITSGAFQTIFDSIDSLAFVTKLTATGSSLLFSTYLGGDNSNVGQGIALDQQGFSYVAGTTASDNFPVTSGAFQTQQTGSFSAFVTKLNLTGTSLLYSTYLGGSEVDEGFALTVDNNGSAYVTGETCSPDFPVTSSAFQTIFGGGLEDAFITKLHPSGRSLVYSSYLGGSSRDIGVAIAIDPAGSAYITGGTESDNFPVTSGAFQSIASGFETAFITKVNPTGTALSYSTLLGGSGTEQGNGIAVDSFGNAWIAGDTESDNFPVTADAFQNQLMGITDAFFSLVSYAGTGLLFSTYYGGSNTDQSFALAIDPQDRIYATGQTESPNFPITPGAFQSMFDSAPTTTDAFVVKIGFDSPPGVTGATGPTGAVGPRGPRGARGARGKSNNEEGV
ncbi:SBBP repeat-containing protein [Mechercharimyces sp. CAU 1602]|uniref:SBBP repeat-containing protein n=1 Tax=Mechercharimyces sp. CAU 1602 TaxID=2973933 RepID=UPI0021636B77|nr:SBBP repeat-containing protein [Mechercharimyces sp. CAU 1602]MCS1352162.1 SBBP repeat-containing protein [Mechercharimyces sp. CAU 1602]